jgi:hypothetical protein
MMMGLMVVSETVETMVVGGCRDSEDDDGFGGLMWFW